MLNRSRLRFSQHIVATLVTALAVLLFLVLGNWQLDRAAEKRALYAGFERAGPYLPLPPASVPMPRYQRVTAQGCYDSDHQFLLDNLTHAGRAGVHVLTPLLLADGNAVLVNRGWLPFGATRALLPEVAIGTDLHTISGRLDQLPRPAIRMEAQPASGWPRLISYPRMEELSAAAGREFHPQLILLDPREPDGFVREWSVPGTTPDRHLGYAVQWFAFAATAIAIWFALGLRRTGESE